MRCTVAYMIMPCLGCPEYRKCMEPRSRFHIACSAVEILHPLLILRSQR